MGLSLRAPLRADGRAAQLLRNTRRRFYAAAGQEHGESIAAHPCDQCTFAGAARQQLGDTLNDFIAHMHAVILVDDVQLIDVDVQQTVRVLGRLRRGQLRRGLSMERGRCQKAGQGIEAQADDLRGLARQQFQRFGIAQLKVAVGIDSENGEHAEDAPRFVANRCRDRLVWHRRNGAVERQT
jgi:hypothetical protein